MATVNRDISYLRQQSKYNIKKYIDELCCRAYFKRQKNNIDNEIAMKEQEISENKSQITNQIF
jgi:hypothetical protein